MKRFLCIKNFFMVKDYSPVSERLAFKAGEVYQVKHDYPDGTLVMESLVTSEHHMEYSFMKSCGYFRELEPIDDELYENPLEDWHPLTLMEERQIPAWARIAVAVFISAIVLFLIATI